MLNCVDYIYFLEEISYKNKVKFLKAKGGCELRFTNYDLRMAFIDINT